LFFDVRRPSNFKSFLDALVDGAIVFVMRKRAVGLGALSLGNFHVIPQLHGRNSE
jgi:hypothetical protein